MREAAERAAGAAKSAGAAYADVRAIESRWEEVETKNGRVAGLERGESIGLGVRALAEGAWGFAATSDLSSGAGCSATAVGAEDAQTLAYPAPFGGQHSAGGYEVVTAMRMLESAPRVGEEAVALLAAPQCPAGEKDLVLGSSQLGLQIHE